MRTYPRAEESRGEYVETFGTRCVLGMRVHYRQGRDQNGAQHLAESRVVISGSATLS